MPSQDFVEWKTILDEDGVVQAVVTYRSRASGERLWSFSFMRTFDKEGISHRTCWVNARHAPAIIRLIPRVLEEIDRAEQEYKRSKFE